MSEWHGYLLGQGGLFTGNPFNPPSTFCNVDCLILSNVKYRHQVAFNFPAWSLVDVFMVSLQNPHHSTVAEGLSVFKHYGKEFFADRIVRPGAEEIHEMIAPPNKSDLVCGSTFKYRSNPGSVGICWVAYTRTNPGVPEALAGMSV